VARKVGQRVDPESEPAGRLYSAREISELEKERETLHRLSLEVDAEIANETEKIAADGEEEAAPVEREPEPELDVEGNPIEKRAAESEQTDGQKAEAISALLARLVARPEDTEEAAKKQIEEYIAQELPAATARIAAEQSPAELCSHALFVLGFGRPVAADMATLRPTAIRQEAPEEAEGDEEVPAERPAPLLDDLLAGAEGLALSTFGEYCPVALRSGKLVSGSTRYAATFNDQLYLCSSEGAQNHLCDNPSVIVGGPKLPPRRVIVVGPAHSQRADVAAALAAKHGVPLVALPEDGLMVGPDTECARKGHDYKVLADLATFVLPPAVEVEVAEPAAEAEEEAEAPAEEAAADSEPAAEPEPEAETAEGEGEGEVAAEEEAEEEAAAPVEVPPPAVFEAPELLNSDQVGWVVTTGDAGAISALIAAGAKADLVIFLSDTEADDSEEGGAMSLWQAAWTAANPPAEPEPEPEAEAEAEAEAAAEPALELSEEEQAAADVAAAEKAAAAEAAAKALTWEGQVEAWDTVKAKVAEACKMAEVATAEHAESAAKLDPFAQAATEAEFVDERPAVDPDAEVDPEAEAPPFVAPPAMGDSGTWDIVALNSGLMVPGKSDVCASYQGEFYLFSSEENRATFIAAPAGFADGLDEPTPPAARLVISSAPFVDGAAQCASLQAAVGDAGLPLLDLRAELTKLLAANQKHFQPGTTRLSSDILGLQEVGTLDGIIGEGEANHTDTLEVARWGKTTFEQFDGNGDGKLNKKELSRALKSLPKTKPKSAPAGGESMKFMSVDEMIEAMDADGDGAVDLGEWLSLIGTCAGLAAALAENVNEEGVLAEYRSLEDQMAKRKAEVEELEAKEERSEEEEESLAEKKANIESIQAKLDEAAANKGAAEAATAEAAAAAAAEAEAAAAAAAEAAVLPPATPTWQDYVSAFLASEEMSEDAFVFGDDAPKVELGQLPDAVLEQCLRDIGIGFGESGFVLLMESKKTEKNSTGAIAHSSLLAALAAAGLAAEALFALSLEPEAAAAAAPAFVPPEPEPAPEPVEGEEPAEPEELELGALEEEYKAQCTERAEAYAAELEALTAACAESGIECVAQDGKAISRASAVADAAAGYTACRASIFARPSVCALPEATAITLLDSGRATLSHLGVNCPVTLAHARLLSDGANAEHATLYRGAVYFCENKRYQVRESDDRLTALMNSCPLSTATCHTPPQQRSSG